MKTSADDKLAIGLSNRTPCPSAAETKFGPRPGLKVESTLPGAAVSVRGKKITAQRPRRHQRSKLCAGENMDIWLSNRMSILIRTGKFKSEKDVRISNERGDDY